MSAVIPQWGRPIFSPEQRDLAKKMRDPDFNATKYFEDLRRRALSGEAEAERKAAEEAAQDAKDAQDKAIEIERFKRDLERKHARAEAEAKARDGIEAIRQRTEKYRAEWEAARVASILKNNKW